jgi:phospholipid-binding lipoprotein MlaA
MALAALSALTAVGAAPDAARAQDTSPPPPGSWLARSPYLSPDTPQTRILDPIEPLNRGFFKIDKAITHVFAGPGRLIITAKWMPRPMREGLYNAFDNLDEPSTFANDILQRKVRRAAITAGRFGINTTVGVVGVFDVASRMGLKRTREDFGQTLGFYGITPGPYLYLPLAGPTTTRDTLGAIADGLFSPLGWVDLTEIERRSIQVAKATLQPSTIGIRQIARGAAAAGETRDEYATLRQLYYDQRAAQITDMPNLADNPIAVDPDEYPYPKGAKPPPPEAPPPEPPPTH